MQLVVDPTNDMPLIRVTCNTGNIQVNGMRRCAYILVYVNPSRYPSMVYLSYSFLVNLPATLTINCYSLTFILRNVGRAM